MASSSNEKMNNALKLGKLKGANYRTWVFNLHLYLVSLDLFEHADGSAVAPNWTGENVAALQRAFNSRS